MSEQYELYHNYPDWKSNIKEYEFEKKNLKWGINPKPEIISHKVMKQRENIFNPISQKYYDENYNKEIKFAEEQKLINVVSQNYDKSLRSEQTFNIINLKDKLSGFENHPNYPTQKNDFKKNKLENSNTNFNIISNITLDKHSYLPPEKRIKITEETKEIKPQKLNALNYKDYDIISNKYRLNNEAKTIIDKEVSKLNSAKNYWTTHNYDIIENKFYDNKIQEEYHKKQNDDAMKKTLIHQKKEPLYNSVNHLILDDKKLKENDNIEKSKKKRYDIKYKMENFYHNKNLEEDSRKERSLDKKLSYQRFKTIDNRGYDVINFKNNYQQYKNSVNVKDTTDDWQHLIKNVGDKQTLETKGIYRDPYDFRDNEDNAHLFKINRTKNNQKLPDITEDILYSQTSIQKKKKFINTKNENKDMIIRDFQNIDKNTWFNSKKDNSLFVAPNDINVNKDPKFRIMGKSQIKRKSMF